jgi:hypothetical protein
MHSSVLPDARTVPTYTGGGHERRFNPERTQEYLGKATIATAKQD